MGIEVTIDWSEPGVWANAIALLALVVTGFLSGWAVSKSHKANQTAEEALEEARTQTKLNLETVRVTAVTQLREVLDRIDRVKGEREANGDIEGTRKKLKDLSVGLLEVCQLLPPDTKVKSFVWEAYRLVADAHAGLGEAKVVGLERLDSTAALHLLLRIESNFKKPRAIKELSLSEALNMTVQQALIATAAVVAEMRFYDGSNPNSEEFTQALRNLRLYPDAERFTLKAEHKTGA